LPPYRLPLTTVRRTLLDLAEHLSLRDLERATDQALGRRLVSRAALGRALELAPGRRGGARLRAMLQREAGPALTRSEAEARLLSLVRAGGLPDPQTSKRLGRDEVDFVWQPHRLIVEVDGFAFHSTRAAFERDRRRDAELHAGFRVMGVTWRQIVEEPEALLVRLTRALVANGRAQ
jgi:very-short-patch-repair endonuclease